MGVTAKRVNSVRSGSGQRVQQSTRQYYVPGGSYLGQLPVPDAGGGQAGRPSRPDRGEAVGPVKWNGRRVPHFYQGADPWDDRKLNQNDTIASAGCAVSCVAMVLSYFGRSVTPAEVDAQLDANNGYLHGSDGIANWDVALAAKALPGVSVKLDQSIRLYEGGDAAEMYRVIEAHLARNMPVIGRVKYGSSSATYNHFVVIVGRNRDGQHVINDPALQDGNGAANPRLPNVVLETAARNGGLALVGIQSLNVRTA